MLRRMMFLLLLAVLALPLFPARADENMPLSPLDLPPDNAIAWMELTYRLVESQGVSAPAAGRIYAYAGVTAYEAVMPGMPDNRSLVGQLNDFNDLPFPDLEQAYDWEASLAAAMATVLPKLFDNLAPENLKAIEDLRDTQLGMVMSSEEIVERSIAYGESVGQGILDWMSRDGYREARAQPEYVPPSGAPELWVVPEGAKPNEPYWGMIRPFVMEFTDVCAQPLDLPFSTDPNSTMYLQAKEVMDVGNDLTDWQTETAQYWVDTPGISGTPSGHWVSIENQLAQQLGLRLDRTVEMYAMVGIVLGDAFISTWSLKYQVLLLRPDAYIQKYLQPRWRPYIETPPFPEYPSGHSTVSVAAAETLTRLFGTVAFTDRTHIIYNHQHIRTQRSYTSFYAAANEAAISRLYGGIHFRVGIENGLEQGRCVAEAAFRNVRLNPVRQGE